MEYGLGISSATEIVTHIKIISNGQVILSLDTKNAYNSIKQSYIYDRVSVTPPPILHFWSEEILIRTRLGFCSKWVLHSDPLVNDLFTGGLHTIAQEEVQITFQPESQVYDKTYR